MADIQETLNSLSECPTEEEAEAILQAHGTSGKEAANSFIERLLEENLRLKRANVELREQLERVNKLGEEMLRRLEVVAGIEPSADHGWYYVMGEVERQVAALHQLTEATDDGMKLLLKRAGLNNSAS